jgi:hypothetical protein
MTYRLFFGCDFNGIGHHQRSSLFGDASDLIERADDLQSNHKATTKQPQSNHKAITKQSQSNHTLSANQCDSSNQ